MTVNEESIYETAATISPKSITSLKSLKRSPRNYANNRGSKSGSMIEGGDHYKYEGWLRVFEGTLNEKYDTFEWHNGFIVCRSDEQSLICYPTEGTAKTFARFLPSIRLDDPLPLENFQLPSASNYSSPISAYEQLPPRPPSRKKYGILPGLSATIDRVAAKRTRNMTSSSMSSHSNYASRSATVSRYYGSEITVLDQHHQYHHHHHHQHQSRSSTIRSKSAKTFAQKFYYSTLRTIRGLPPQPPSSTNPSLSHLPPTTSSTASTMISTIPSGGSGSQFSIASAWEIAERNRNGGFLFRNNRSLKPSNKDDHRRFSRSCDELDNLDNCNNYSNASEYSVKIPQTPFGRRKPRIIARSPLVASPMLFRQSPRNLRSKSNAAHRNGVSGCGLQRLPLQYSVTLNPTVTTIPIGQQQKLKDHNYGKF